METSQDQRLGQLAHWFIEHNKTLSFAESCTGGLLSSTMTRRPGVSQFFLGSVVSYHRSLKIKLLGVPESTIQTFGEVSEPVVKAMAQGARQSMGSDWSVAISGIAGPGGGSPEKPVGTVCFAVAGPGFVDTVQKVFKNKTREELQRQSVHFALEALCKAIL